MRGVNKLVLEIKPENEYFEKALLFLKPEMQTAPQKEISDGAEKLLYKIKNSGREKPDRLLFIMIGILAGAAVSWLTVFLIGIL